MKKLINKIFTNGLRVYSFFTLPQFNGDYFVKPKLFYISQFLSIQPSTLDSDKLIDDKKLIKVYGAKNSQEFTFWAWRNCGIACVKMILNSKKKCSKKTMMELTNEGIEFGGYVLYEGKKFVDKGWFHRSLVLLLNKYGVKARMKKWQSLESVAKDVLKNKKVILSIYVPTRKTIKTDGSFKPKKKAEFGGHLVLVTGVSMSNSSVNGFYVHDPRGLEKYQKKTFISKKVFNRIFTGRTIVANFNSLMI